MKQRVLIAVLVLGMCGTSANAQTQKIVNKTKPVTTRKLMIERNGFEWYLVKNNDKVGVESKDGKILVPMDTYSHVLYTGGFEVMKGDETGYYKGGTLIIPFSKRYHNINYMRSSAGTYYQAGIKGTDDHLIFWNDDGEEICEVGGYLLAEPNFDEGKFFWTASGPDNKRYLLDGNGNVMIGPVNYFEVHNGNVRKGSGEVLMSLSSISTTNNPFSKKATKGIKYSSKTSSSSSSSSSSNSNSGNNTTTIIVEQHSPVQVWIACGGCQYEPGKCSYCHGSGWGYNSRLCSRCGGNGKCTICGGNGGHYEVHYR